ncbi:DUF4159 domain-containing protein [Gaopeijia maritima]|uniref:DUF4159 domain-containing protein n=1 Tax=Gaopeijia maritima TaxID=3119007 RepID=A0ABU9E8Z9_9BACT
MTVAALLFIAALAPASAPPATVDSVTIARLRYDGGGDWYADPSSLPNLLEALSERTGIPVSRREVVVSALDPGLRDHPYLYMTGHGNVRFSAPERAALRGYLLDGGFLHVDDNYGLDESFRREIAALFPDRELAEIPPDHPVFHGLYDLPEGLPKVHEHDGGAPQAFGIFDDGRLMVFYSYESDLGDGWEDEATHDNPAEVREAALRMGVNLFLYALAGGRGT